MAENKGSNTPKRRQRLASSQQNIKSGKFYQKKLSTVKNLGKHDETLSKDEFEKVEKIVPNFSPNDLKKKYTTFRLERVESEHYAPTTEKSKNNPDNLVQIEEHSAGGIVLDQSKKNIAVICRKNSDYLIWSLPKGHLEKNENPEDTAVREVEEETGIQCQILEMLGIIDYYFTVQNYRIHKLVHHFALQQTKGSFFEMKDPDEEVQRILWIPIDKAQYVLSYSNEKKILRLMVTRLGLNSKND